MVTLTKAIEILQDINNNLTSAKTADSIASISLAIEVMKCITSFPNRGWLPDQETLPGEEKE